ncbi:hypothetical protein [Streptomyces sp. I05A-00742]|uniref:hypothetical protein n=1 Tax=Streptomyces sp. I05A-00742 TaxID=2732853 RepID=UPI00148871B9|nr:hypothetical protein [Streptomyces sp. I05A-00742]
MTLRAAAFLGVLSTPARKTAQTPAGEPSTARAGFFLDDVVTSGKEALEAWKQEAAVTVNHVIALGQVAEQHG